MLPLTLGAPQRNTVLTRKNKEDHNNKSSISLGMLSGKFSVGGGGSKNEGSAVGGGAGAGAGGGGVSAGGGKKEGCASGVGGCGGGGGGGGGVITRVDGANGTANAIANANASVRGRSGSHVLSLMTGGLIGKGRGSIVSSLASMGGVSTKGTHAKGKAAGQGLAIGVGTATGMGQNRASVQGTARGPGLDKLAPIKESGENNAELGIAKACKQELIDRSNAMAR